jgi:hypothetical protein
MMLILLFRYLILSALSLNSILHLDIQNFSFTAAIFYDFVNGLLDNINPFPLCNSIVVMDNASIHHGMGVQDLIEGQ